MTKEMLRETEISVHFADVLIDRAEELGIGREYLCRASGLNPEVLGNSRARITPAQLGALLRRVWADLDDELAGFGAVPHRFGCFALMARQMVDSATLGQALHYSCRFYNLTSHSLRWTIDTSDEVKLSLTLLDPDADSDHFLEEFLLMVWHRFSNWLVAERIPLLGTRFRFPRPVHHREHQLMFPGPISYDSPSSAIRFDGSWLRAPVRRTRSELSEYLQTLPDEWFIKQQFLDSVSQQVIDALEESEWQISLEGLADRWHMSRRTLHRQLLREGNSFRTLLEQSRRDRAIALLRNDSCRIKEVAWALGMTEPAFSRAFKQWTGYTPLALRKLDVLPQGL